MWLFESSTLDRLPVGTFASLKAIHKALFEDVYDFAGELRTVNLAKGNFRFAPLKMCIRDRYSCGDPVH